MNPAPPAPATAAGAVAGVGPETWLPRLVVLPCRRNAPSGSLPRAFSDMPRSCNGTASSADGPPSADAVLDMSVGEAAVGEVAVIVVAVVVVVVGGGGGGGDPAASLLLLASSASEPSSDSEESSPISKASGDDGVGGVARVWRGRCISAMLKDTLGEPSPLSLRSRFSRSTSSRPCSSVKFRSDSNRRCWRRIA